MNLEQLMTNFFGNRNVQCESMEIENSILAKPDVVLPLVMLLVKQAINDTELEGAVVSFQLKKQSESLCLFVIEDIVIKSQHCVINIAQEICDCEDIPGIYLKDNQVVILDEIVRKFRSVLSNIDDGNILDCNDLFKRIFGDTFTLKLRDDFTQSQLKTLNYSFDQDQLQELKVDLFDDIPEQEVVQKFELKQRFKSLTGVSKQLFEELAVIAAGAYQSSNPEQSIIALKAEKLPTIDCTMFLAAVLSIPEILTLIADKFDSKFYQLAMPKTVYQLRENLVKTADKRSFSGANDSSTTWYHEAKSKACQLAFSPELQLCLNYALKNNELNGTSLVYLLFRVSDQVIADTISLNQSNNRYVQTTIASQSLTTYLSEKVIGQNAAINCMSQGYLSSSIDVSEGPRLIFTFAGPSGVGKTYLSCVFAEALEKFEQTGYVFNTFNMEQYSDARDALKLFGSGSQYTDASLGILTAAVRAQPRQVLLFDEIEKADISVIQSLLSVLDKGKVQDQTSQEMIDFTQCIVIFTTNLGQELFEENPQNHQLNVFDVLRNSKNKASGTQLSYEFINRLAKGFPVLFSSLKTNHFIRLVERELTQSDNHPASITFNWPNDFASFLLRSIAPEISVRQLNGVLPKLKAMILRKAGKLFTPELGAINFCISVDKASDNQDSKSPVLLLDDDNKIHHHIEQLRQSNSVALCSSRAEIKSMLEKHRPQALLIDVESLVQTEQSLAEEISDIQSLNSGLAIFTYRLVSSNFSAESSISVSHDVREHFTIELGKIETDLPAMITRVEYYVQMEQTLQTMNSRYQSLTYQCSVSANENTFNVHFSNISNKRLIQVEDLNGGNLFKHSLPDNTLDDVIGLDRAKQRLIDVIGWLKHPDKLGNFGVRLPSGFLFAGPPGTGKTLLAKAVAGECQLPFFSVSSTDLSAPHTGGTTDNIKKLFATARKYAPSIIFIDEIDAIATQRTSDNSGSARDKNLTVNALLTEMDGFNSNQQPVFVMAATNHPQLLDKAITRPGRFDETIYCDLPNKVARQAFFELFAKKHNLDWQPAELIELVSSAQGMSAAEIEQVLREAIYQAVGDSKALTTEHIKQSMVRIVYGAPSDQIKLSPEEKRRTAFHEAAHLLTYKLLFPNQRIDFVTIEPRNQSLGFVSTRPADEYESYSKRTVMNRLQVLLAGRVAEKICSGSVDEVSTGASNDIEKATQLAMHAIYEGGIEPTIGPINVTMLTKFEESELLSKAQLAVKQWLEQADQQVEVLLMQHSQKLTYIAETLQEKESLLANEIEQLFTKQS